MSAEQTDAGAATTDEELGPGELLEDRVAVRTLREDDLADLIRVDRAAMGRAREEYYRAKVRAALREATLQASLVAELDDRVVGFALATLYYGEFGRPEPVAVVDSLGVDPEYRHRHVGRALMRQLLMNLRALGVERVETQVTWEQLDVLRFLASQGFRPAARIALELEL